MLCKRCPHLVRHGRVGEDGSVVFKNNCGLLMKAETLEAGGEMAKKPGRKPTKKPERKPPPVQVPLDDSYSCTQVPFPESFDYLDCDVYRTTFKGGNRKFGVVPTKDFQYSDVLNSSSITDLELL